MIFLRVAAKAKKVIYILDGQIAGSKEFKTGEDHKETLSEWLKGFESKA